MAVAAINALLSPPVGTGSERPRVPPGRGAGPERESRDHEPGGARSGGTRYRVDDAYRAYSESRNNAPPSRTNGESGELRRVRSSELLSSMIHQMGGSATSSAKGVFVDIAV